MAKSYFFPFSGLITFSVKREENTLIVHDGFTCVCIPFESEARVPIIPLLFFFFFSLYLLVN